MDFSVTTYCGGGYGGLDIQREDLFLAPMICGAVGIGYRIGLIARRAHHFPAVASVVASATVGIPRFSCGS